MTEPAWKRNGRNGPLDWWLGCQTHGTDYRRGCLSCSMAEDHNIDFQQKLDRERTAGKDGVTAAHAPSLFETFKDLAGRCGWDTEQEHAGGLFRDKALQALWNGVSRNPRGVMDRPPVKLNESSPRDFGQGLDRYGEHLDKPEGGNDGR